MTIRKHSKQFTEMQMDQLSMPRVCGLGDPSSRMAHHSAAILF